MWGEPPDVEGECNARLYVGDTFGDNHSTFRCQLKPGHEGRHQEKHGEAAGNPVEVTWKMDESIHSCHLESCGKEFRSIERDLFCSKACDRLYEKQEEEVWGEYKKTHPEIDEKEQDS